MRNAGSTDSTSLRAGIVDLTGRSRPYDFHLANAMTERRGDFAIWIGGKDERSTGKKDRVCEPPFNFASRLSMEWRRTRKILKAIEYMGNLICLYLWGLRERIDVFHFQWLPLLEVAPAFELLHLRWAQSRGFRIVYTVHNVLPHDTGNEHRSAYRNVYHCVDALICHTGDARRRLVDEFGVEAEKIWVIPHGPLSEEISFVPQEKARDELQLDPESLMCLLFGFIRPYKGAKFLINAWRRVIDQEPAARLVLAGKPEEKYGETLLEKIETLKLTREIDTCFKFIPQDKLSLLVHAADVLVYPYRSITQSGALLTGLTTGKPVVATDVGGFSEMIQHGETGTLVEYGDEEQLAEVLVRLLRDEERREQLGDAAKQMVETEYSWDAIAQKTLECYRKVANKT